MRNLNVRIVLYNFTIIASDLSQLRIDVISDEDMFAPDGVPTLNETEDAQIVHIIAQREPEVLQNSLSGPNIGAGSLLRDKIGIKQLAAIFIQRGDQGPHLSGEG